MERGEGEEVGEPGATLPRLGGPAAASGGKPPPPPGTAASPPRPPLTHPPPTRPSDAVPFARPKVDPADAPAAPPADAKPGKRARAAAAYTPPAATRFIALQLFYLGWAYNGFSSAGDVEDDGTVEVRGGREC